MEVVCEDFLAFEETLKKLRKFDDFIVHSLNTTVPTSSFEAKGTDPTAQCKDLYKQLTESHSNREKTIKNCIITMSETVHSLRKRREENEEDFEVYKELRNKQNKLRLLQNELNVEEVIRDRSLKIFHERCRAYYRPDQ